MFEFAHIEDLWFLWFIPVMFILFIILRYKRKKIFRRFGDPELVRTLIPLVSAQRPVLKFILLLTSLVFIVLTLAGPRFGSRLEEVKREGVEIIIALDVSNSMNAEDIRPNRLERSKLAISRLISNLRNDRIGLIVYAGDAYVQVPITSDYTAARMILENISTDIIPVQGTAMGRAIDLASRSFTPDSPASRALIIISDGEDHEDDPVKAAAAAREMDITVHTIGIGRPEGVPIPVSGGGQSRFLTDEEGNTVMTRLDEPTLRAIASAGEGMYIRAGSSGTGLDVIMDEIDKMETAEFEEMVYTEFEERFQYMAALALLFLIIDFLILERKNRWLNSINLFNADTDKD
jgi:Ca-activated chloride channel homolog